MTRKQDERLTETKEKIIKAAETLFSDKGYDAASMDEIAAAAGITKSLIYYYFKSKQEILDEISRRFIEQVVSIKQAAARDFLSDPPNNFTRLMETAFDFIGEWEKTIRTMYMEAIKQGSQPHLFGMIDAGFTAGAAAMQKETGVAIEKSDEALLYGFFFGSLPIISFAVLKQQWCRYFKISEARVKELFIKVYADFYLNFLIKKFIP